MRHFVIAPKYFCDDVTQLVGPARAEEEGRGAIIFKNNNCTPFCFINPLALFVIQAIHPSGFYIQISRLCRYEAERHEQPRFDREHVDALFVREKREDVTLDISQRQNIIRSNDFCQECQLLPKKIEHFFPAVELSKARKRRATAYHRSFGVDETNVQQSVTQQDQKHVDTQLPSRHALGFGVIPWTDLKCAVVSKKTFMRARTEILFTHRPPPPPEKKQKDEKYISCIKLCILYSNSKKPRDSSLQPTANKSSCKKHEYQGGSKCTPSRPLPCHVLGTSFNSLTPDCPPLPPCLSTVTGTSWPSFSRTTSTTAESPLGCDTSTSPKRRTKSPTVSPAVAAGDPSETCATRRERKQQQATR